MCAVGFSGGATAATVPDQEVGEKGPVRFRHNFDQGLLHFHGILMAGQAQAAGEAAHVGIHDNSFGQVEGVPENHIGSLSPDARQLVKFLHCFGDTAPVLLKQAASAALDGFCLGPKEAGGANNGLQLGQGDFGVVPCGAASGKKGGSHFVNPFIRALGRKNGGHQQFQSVTVM